MINLKEVYGKRYKMGIDACFALESRPGKTAEIAWYYELLGQNGQLYNHSEDRLQLWISKPRIGKRICSALPSHWTVVQNASDGVAFSLPNSDISTAFRWLKPKRRRVMSPEQVKQASERLQAWKFPARQSGKTG